MPLREFKVDLHIHTCLSPCADPGMLPTALVREAVNQNLDAIGICDHNSAENVEAVKKAGAKCGLHVLGGMEITSREEVHILGLFDDDAPLQEAQAHVYGKLSGQNDEAYFGEQLVADEDDRIVGTNSRLLIGATEIGIDEIVAFVHGLGGLAVASHVDREAYSIIGQLGFVPEGLPLDALGLSPNCDRDEIDSYRKYGISLVACSDAHFPADIGKSRTTFVLDTLSFGEIAMALRGIDGRKVVI